MSLNIYKMGKGLNTVLTNIKRLPGIICETAY